MKKSFQAAALLTLVIGGFILATRVSAYDLIVPFPGQTEPITGPASYIRTLYTFGLGFGALLAMVMIIIGAVQYTMSEAVTSKEEATQRIQGAIWGLVLLLAATLILFTINPTLPDLIEPELAPVPEPSPSDTTTPPPNASDPKLAQNIRLSAGPNRMLQVEWDPPADATGVTRFMVFYQVDDQEPKVATTQGTTDNSRVLNVPPPTQDRPLKVWVKPMVGGKFHNQQTKTTFYNY